MSSAHDAHGGSSDAHAAHAHDAYDGEPATALSPGEPRTPGWLPLLGLALFVSAGVYFLVGGDSPAGATQAPLAPMDLAAPPPPPPPAAPRPSPVAPGMRPAQPAGSADGLRKMTPQQMDELRKKIEDARAKGGLPGQPPPSAHP